MQQAVTNFKTSLLRVRNIASDVTANASQALQDPALRERHETILSAVVVTLSGFFESFLREIAEEYADHICRQNHPFVSLKPIIKQTHFRSGGKVLDGIGGQNRTGKYTWTTSPASDVARRLASVNSGPPYEIVWEAFVEVSGNPGSQALKNFLKRFGVTRPMETLALHANKTPQTLSLLLDSFIAVRNEAAHTGIVTQQTTPSAVLDYCDFLEEVADAVVNTLQANRLV